jgi:hypothetical protein
LAGASGCAGAGAALAAARSRIGPRSLKPSIITATAGFSVVMISRAMLDHSRSLFVS